MTPQPTATDPESGTSWMGYADILLRWRRFLLIGLTACLVATILVAVLWPRGLWIEATLSLPTIPEATASETVRPGIPLATYKALDRSMSDLAVLREAFRNKLGDDDIRQLQADLSQHLTPITTGTRDDWRRIDKDDKIIAVRLYDEGPSEDKIRNVVDVLARLVRETLMVIVAEQRVETELMSASSAASKAADTKMELSYLNDSLQVMSADLERLVATFPEGGQRELVDVKEGGYHYLPPRVQMVGVKAEQAENEHKMRLAERAFRVQTLKKEFLRRIEAQIRQQFQNSRMLDSFDVSALYDKELRAFLAANGSPHAAVLAIELRTTGDIVTAQRRMIAFTQYPTVRRMSLPRLPIIAGVAVALLIFLTPVVAETWTRYHSEAVAGPSFSREKLMAVAPHRGGSE